MTDAPPVTFPAKETQLLKKRFDLGLNGFVFLPCELIDKNGVTLKKVILQYADLRNLGANFKAWVEDKNIFCNTLVDRINTGFPKDEKIDLGYEGNMLNTSEYFHLWVIDGYKDLCKEIPFDKCGLNVIVTESLEMYRTRKEKSLGCVQKGGLSEVVDVLDYGDTLKENGLSLLNGPGNDIVAVTNLTAAGVHMIL